MRNPSIESRYFPAFDFLRIFLSILVACSHAGLVPYERAGNLAVQIFFSLSGFLIGAILVRSGMADLPRFYYNRATRIWGPYFVALALLVCASLMKDDITRTWAEFVFMMATFVYNFFGPPALATLRDAMPLDGTGNHFWSIAAEEQFYLIAPLIIAILPGRFGKSPLWWALLSFSIMLSPLRSHFTSISLGVLTATCLYKFPDLHLNRWFRSSLFILTPIIFVMLFTRVLPYSILVPICSISLVLLLAAPGSRSNIGTFLGGLSYPMYLNHWIGLIVANEIFELFDAKGTIVCGIAGVILGLIFSTILYCLVDVPIMKHRTVYYTDFRGKSFAVISYFLVIFGFLGVLTTT